MNEQEKWSRTRRAAKHVVAAVVFMESSRASFEETRGSLLSCIGYYYAGFHAAVAMLWLAPSIATESMKRLRHSQLKTLVEQHLVQTKLLDRAFLHEYQQLQDFREYANYQFGSKAPEYEYTRIAPILPVVTDSMLTKMRETLLQQLEALDMVFGLQTAIGDDIGTDLVKLHCGPAVTDKVWDYLVTHKLTT